MYIKAYKALWGKMKCKNEKMKKGNQKINQKKITPSFSSVELLTFPC